MVDGVDQGFLDSGDRIIPEAFRFRPVGMLDDRLLEMIPRDEVDRLAQDDGQRAAKLLLVEAIAAGAVGKPHDVDLGCGKEAVRRFVEEQQPDVLGKARLGRTADDVQAPAQRFGRKPRFPREVAAHVPQKPPKQPIGQVLRR